MTAFAFAAAVPAVLAAVRGPVESISNALQPCAVGSVPSDES
jgi:hypothetical protein